MNNERFKTHSLLTKHNSAFCLLNTFASFAWLPENKDIFFPNEALHNWDAVCLLRSTS